LTAFSATFFGAGLAAFLLGFATAFLAGLALAGAFLAGFLGEDFLATFFVAMVGELI
jgi:hypothetical protein